jgi:hypothetical protein
MESNERYYARRAAEELRGAQRALTPEGKARRTALAEAFLLKCQAERKLSSRPREINSLAVELATAVSLSGA